HDAEQDERDSRSCGERQGCRRQARVRRSVRESAHDVALLERDLARGDHGPPAARSRRGQRRSSRAAQRSGRKEEGVRPRRQPAHDVGQSRALHGVAQGRTGPRAASVERQGVRRSGADRIQVAGHAARRDGEEDQHRRRNGGQDRQRSERLRVDQRHPHRHQRIEDAALADSQPPAEGDRETVRHGAESAAGAAGTGTQRNSQQRQAVTWSADVSSALRYNARGFSWRTPVQIAVIGTGYVGLVTGAGLADFGNDVTCVDIDVNKIEALKQGKIPIYEPGLDILVSKNVREQRLSFTTDLASSIRNARAIFIAVGTPPRPDGSADLRYVEDVARTIAKHMNGPKLVITKSTVPIGTGRMIEKIISETGPGHKASVVSNPEFLREGSAIEDFMKPDRLVIGASDQESVDLMKEIYAPLHSLEIPFVVTNVESSELIKYASNGFLATKISFINEIAVLCELIGGDVQDVARGVGLDTRIGPKFLQAGPGFGGSCFPKDTSAVADIARRYGYEFQIIEAVLRVNDNIKQRMVGKVTKAMCGNVSGKTIGILGLAFKPETDDMRDSPTIPLIHGLQKQGASIRAYDPQAIDNAKKIFTN